MSLEYLLLTLLIAASPGAGVIFTIAAGLHGGRKAGLSAALGCTLGIVPHMLAAVSGLAMVLKSSDVLFNAFKYCGVAYLLYLAYEVLWGNRKIDGLGRSLSGRGTVFSAIIINILNPKLSFFFLAFLPQFVPADESDPVYLMLTLSLLFMAVTFIVFSTYGMAAVAARSLLLANGRSLTILKSGMAASLVYLAFQLSIEPKLTV
ncbi:LysE family translocator [Pseudomonas kuykendallii]|uniref:Lysine transporter LysE n=1 Tax=Pseudomonas kuykendallii TaxID=1007099 RepID=A0A2W5F240_9PSED|nr:LysE family translocator [Pseudomonas kuykendallii]PZP26456.1 MAG: lysine transporter LysE [Pseudomonas kuykendallii]